jgi:hypothetical protein
MRLPSSAQSLAGPSVCFDWTLYDVVAAFDPAHEYSDGNFVFVRTVRVSSPPLIRSQQLGVFDGKNQLTSLSVSMERSSLHSRKIATSVYADKIEEVRDNRSLQMTLTYATVSTARCAHRAPCPREGQH